MTGRARQLTCCLLLGVAIVAVPSCSACAGLPLAGVNEASKGTLFRAIEARDHDAIRKLLEEPGAVKGINRLFRDRTPLHHAASHFHGNREIIELLLAKGARVDARDADGLTPLMRAVSAPDYWQIPDNAPPEAKAALVQERLMVVDRLLVAGADVNLVNLVTDRPSMFRDFTVGSETGSPLHYAIWSRSVEVARRLIERGAKVDVLDAETRTPLLVALDRGERLDELVDLLLDAGADPRLGRLANGGTALHRAMDFSSAHVVERLLMRGAVREAVDREGRTPLMAPLLSTPQARLLVAAGARTQLADAAGRTALDHALARQRDIARRDARLPDAADVDALVALLRPRKAERR